MFNPNGKQFQLYTLFPEIEEVIVMKVVPMIPVLDGEVMSATKIHMKQVPRKDGKQR